MDPTAFDRRDSQSFVGESRVFPGYRDRGGAKSVCVLGGGGPRARPTPPAGPGGRPKEVARLQRAKGKN